MSCPTCDHTMSLIAHDGRDEQLVRHCPRCGTVKVEDSNWEEPAIYVPKLVERCRAFWLGCTSAQRPAENLQVAWREYGIAESINLPTERPA